MTSLIVDNFQKKADIPALEQAVLDFWDESRAFEKSFNQRPKDKRYVFYDGPPFATGLPHYGHILASTIKDVIPRYWTMKGYRVERVWGWDCHGIPIENIIEQELNLKGGKKAIEQFGIGKFNAACRAAILRFDKEWEKVIRRIGRWVDFTHSYKTMDRSYMESVWWAFKTLHDKGLIYEGKRVILYCPRCATPLSNFEIAMDNSYGDIQDVSTVYMYRVKGQVDTYLLAWSTTPWNKLATPALAVHPDLTYVKVRQNNEHYILAKRTLSILSKEPLTVIEEFKGAKLVGMEFEGHYDFFPREKGKRVFVVVGDSYVTDTEGTGIVTLAIYGEDDYRVMTRENIQMIEHVDDQGKLKPEVTLWAGKDILDVNPLVNEDLKKRGLVYKEETYVHSVPICYRCNTRLYYAPVPAWFIDIQKIKADLCEQNEHINWYPAHLKHGRFGKGLETAPDWNISRSRYWGTPMPIWRSQTKKQQAANSQQITRIIGSIEELKKWAVEPEKVAALTDIHREFLDDVEVWVDDAKTVKGKRIPEVFDCWVESGSMPYASIHYPFENKELFEKTHPAQFIAEYIAQTRAWFYTLHVMSVALFGTHTFENAVTTGTILASDGSKMSKSKKNFPDPQELFETYGVDALRFYLMGSVVMKAENINFSEDKVKEVYQKVISTIWNVLSFYKLFVKTPPPDAPPKATHPLDVWIISRTANLISAVTRAMDGYDTIASCRLIEEFVSDLSTWYVRRSRNRIKTDSASHGVFGWVLLQLSYITAPIIPFISELVYQSVTGQRTSVHLQSWPTADTALVNTHVEDEMLLARRVVELAHAARKEYNIKVRQPLASLRYDYFKRLSVGVETIVAEEVNVKQVQFVQTKKETPDVAVSLDTTLTQELKDEGVARELIHTIQMLRKQRGCAIDARIRVELPREHRRLPAELVARIQKETLADDILWGKTIAILTG